MDFETWVINYLSSDEKYYKLLEEAEIFFHDFLSQNKEYIKALMLQKIRIAKQHFKKDPDYSYEFVKKMVEEECIDIPDWMLALFYSQEVKHGESS